MAATGEYDYVIVDVPPAQPTKKLAETETHVDRSTAPTIDLYGHSVVVCRILRANVPGY